MEQSIDTMPTIRLDDTAVLRFRVLFYYISILAEKCSGFDEFDGCVQAFSCCFNNAYRVRIRFCLLANIVCLVQVAVISTMV